MSSLAVWTAAGGSTAELRFAQARWVAGLDGSPHPSPHELLDAALAACTTLTLHLYAQRKGWPVQGLQVSVRHEGADGAYRMTRSIGFDSAPGLELDAEQVSALLRVADACPVHKTLTGRIGIVTQLVPAGVAAG